MNPLSVSVAVCILLIGLTSALPTLEKKPDTTLPEQTMMGQNLKDLTLKSVLINFICVPEMRNAARKTTENGTAAPRLLSPSQEIAVISWDSSGPVARLLFPNATGGDAGGRKALTDFVFMISNILFNNECIKCISSCMHFAYWTYFSIAECLVFSVGEKAGHHAPRANNDGSKLKDLDIEICPTSFICVLEQLNAVKKTTENGTAVQSCCSHCRRLLSSIGIHLDLLHVSVPKCHWWGCWWT
ncbi:hypothetical protein TNCT_104841 [Trichonephila clavata]|uniref:Uncharacterized protein n=1 Tax=Trichonephila clavata TaxID=2740835 RepID=A0A8X6GY85_TRICU|nr:hypothetical protein TNCT_104841 [Trichonephila clavata]